MASPRTPTSTNSSALFGSDDTSFLQALGDVILSGDITPQAQNTKDTMRDLSPISPPTPIAVLSSSLEPPPCAQPVANARLCISSGDEWDTPGIRISPNSQLRMKQHSEDDEPSLLQPESPTPAQPRYKKRTHSASGEDEDSALAYSTPNSRTGGRSTYLDSDTYGASRFGGFGEYMRRKRAKLQIQNTEIPTATTNKLFKGLSIHINGWTEPSVQELRKLIVEHGGVYHAYIDKKTLVTHIITCSLTPAKVREFKNMKVVRPEWLVNSVKAGVLLPWQDFIFVTGGRVESAQGRLAQRVLTANKSRPSIGGVTPLSKPKPLLPPPGNDKIPSAPRPPPLSPQTQSLGLPSLAPPIPEYAEHESNPAAERAMADPAWRAAHTSVAPGFLAGYYANSRLHHLSTWKAELRTLVAEAQERAERGYISTGPRISEKVATAADSMHGAILVMKNPLKGKEKAGSTAERVIMHVDFDAFFVSAGLVSRPQLRGKPVVVCHSQNAQGGASSTSEIASASYEARKFGIRNGMSVQQARKLCPDLVTIPYEFEKYRQLSLEFYTILMSFADDLQAVSVDEALIDVTSTVAQMKVIPTEIDGDDDGGTSTGVAKELSESIRAQIKATTGCEASIGIASNIMLARLATRRAKPASSFHLLPAAFTELLPTLDVRDLHGFGRAAHDKANEKLGTTNLGELARRSKASLCDALGKSMGETLYNSIRGVDHHKLESDKPRKSVSCDINYGIRFENDDQVEVFIHQMSEEVARRLDALSMKGRSLTLKVLKRDPSAPVEAPKFMGHGQCMTYNKQSALASSDGRATSDPRVIGTLSWRLLRALNIPPLELRGISIQIQKLDAPAGCAPAHGQARLPFRPAPNTTTITNTSTSTEPASKARAPSSELVTVKPESKEKKEGEEEGEEVGTEGLVDLPSFSQVDISVLEALPVDIREELEAEYNRRSKQRLLLPPTPKPELPTEALPHASATITAAAATASATASTAPHRFRDTGVANNNRKGGSSFERGREPRRMIPWLLQPRGRGHGRGHGRGRGRGREPAFQPNSGRTIPAAAAAVTVAGLLPTKVIHVKPSELTELGIDKEVFAALPVPIQREQLAAARGARVRPSQQPVRATSPLKPLNRLEGRWAPPKGPHEYVPPPPPPQARFAEMEKPVLRRVGAGVSQPATATTAAAAAAAAEAEVVVVVVEGSDVRKVVRTWVERFVGHEPHMEDIALIRNYLVRCVATDVGAERAVGVMRWWGALLRRKWGVWEHAEERDEEPEPDEDIRFEVVGMAWWRAFRGVSESMNEIVRKRFGGSLKFR